MCNFDYDRLAIGIPHNRCLRTHAHVYTQHINSRHNTYKNLHTMRGAYLGAPRLWCLDWVGGQSTVWSTLQHAAVSRRLHYTSWIWVPYTANMTPHLTVRAVKGQADDSELNLNCPLASAVATKYTRHRSSSCAAGLRVVTTEMPKPKINKRAAAFTKLATYPYARAKNFRFWCHSTVTPCQDCRSPLCRPPPKKKKNLAACICEHTMAHWAKCVT